MNRELTEDGQNERNEVEEMLQRELGIDFKTMQEVVSEWIQVKAVKDANRQAARSPVGINMARLEFFFESLSGSINELSKIEQGAEGGRREFLDEMRKAGVLDD